MAQNFNEYQQEAADAAAHARWMTSPEGLANQQEGLAKEAYYAYDPASGIPEDVFTQDFINKRIITGPTQTQYERTGKLDLRALENLQEFGVNGTERVSQNGNINNRRNFDNLEMRGNDADSGYPTVGQSFKQRIQSMGGLLPEGVTFTGKGFKLQDADRGLTVNTGGNGGFKAKYSHKY